MWISQRRSPSGRAERRLLNRARACGLCRKPLGAERALYETQAVSASYALNHDLIIAHPTCADALAEENTARLRRQTESLSRLATQVNAGRLIAQTMPVSRSLITVAFAPPAVRAAELWQMP